MIQARAAIFHEDKGNTTAISQLANGCADVLSGRQGALGEELVALASQLLQEIQQSKEQEQCVKLMQEWRERDKKARVDRVMTVDNKRKAEMLLGTFERVSRRLELRTFGACSKGHSAYQTTKLVGL